MLGLNDEEVKVSRNKYGENVISKNTNNSFFRLLIESLGDPIIKILLIALAVKTVFLFRNFDWYETIGILIAIFLASFISSISEYGSNKAFDHLQKESQMLKSEVYRNGKLCEIYNKDIVKDDIISLSSGDKMPADGIIISGELYLDESFLTGETKEVYKKNSSLKDESEVFSSSLVYKGNALIRVTSVGDNTFMGKMSLKMQVKDDESPLKKKLHFLAGQISKLGYIGAFLASGSYLFIEIIVKNNFDINLIINHITNLSLLFSNIIYALTLCVTIIIMAVPEGLPMMITLVLSSNMKKMLKDKVLVRKLVGIETSGSLNVLLCDKTGTLTEGKLSVNEIVSYEKKFTNLKDIGKYKKYYDILCKSLILNNESKVSDNEVIGGNITDKAIMAFFKDININGSITEQKYFDSKSKYSYVCSFGNYYFKGASEVLMPFISSYLNINGEERPLLKPEIIKKEIDFYTEKGYRVLINAKGSNKNMRSLCFISVVVISDQIRKESLPSIELIKKAGIKPVMITGDALKTAKYIAENLNMLDSTSIILTHSDLEKMSNDYLKSILSNISVIARALPEDKERLVTLYKEEKMVVGMTGDGVNDILALKKSDVSFAMGSGSEVAKEASDIVILDNNILSITKAILYGRTIFKSIRKFVTYQLTVNICALFLSIVGTLIGITNPITIIQMLWLNMIMDTFAGLAFSYEPPLLEYMSESPKKIDEKIINKYMFNQIVVNGLYSAILCILFLKLPFIKNLFRPDYKIMMTAFFALFIFLGITNSFLSRTHRLNIFANITKNKVFLFIMSFIIIVQIYIIYNGKDLFRTYGLTLKELFYVILISQSIVIIDFIRKRYLKAKNISLSM